MLLLAGTVTEGRRYTAPAGPGWRFTLDPGEFGWTIRLIARNGDDLAQVTPPFHFVNPRYLDGWHFRNRANTGPNQGDVNAPQEIRDFIFDRAIDPELSDAAKVAKAEGRCVLEITGYTLSPPRPGANAHFTWLAFEACLTWPAAWGTR